MVTFRRRNLLLSGGVLFVLALGVSMALLAAERARALAEMQAEFILGVSHELRTPLTVITVAADNLKNGMVNNSAQVRSYGGIIHKHSAELANMIEETFSFARMRSETIERRSPVTPEQIVRDAVAENDFALRDSGLNVEIGLAPELPQVEVDLHLIKRCVGNLLQNAAKYAAAGQRLAVHARTAVKRDKEMVEISVEDYGPGISEDDLAQIFEPFYRGEAADSSHAPGIGLGLTLVKRAVEAHGGAVEVESGSTTRFSIFLPSHRTVPNGAKV
jgi:signal transduction histidine kinase